MDQKKEPLEFVVESCAQTGLPVCQRAYVINLALGYDQDFYIPRVLANENQESLQDFFSSMKNYIFSRECFKKTWLKMDNPETCPLKKDCAFSLCFEKV